MEEEKKNNRKKQLVIGLLVLFLIGNGILVYQLIKSNQELQDTRDDLVSTEEMADDLSKEIDELNLELEDYQQRVHEKDTALENRNKELSEQAEELQRAVRERNLSREELAEKREELGRLRYYTRKYQAQIDSLERTNVRLREEKEEYAENLAEEKRRYDQVKDENVLLSNKVSTAERLRTQNMEAAALRTTAIGNRERTTTRKERVEKFRVCFTIEDNSIASTGKRNVYVRFISPEGRVFNVEEAGRGEFEFQGEMIPYTTVYEMDYQNDEYSECFRWQHTGQLVEGEYDIKLYTEGYELATDKLTIR